jgi:PilZ domain
VGGESCVAKVHNLSHEGIGFFIDHELTIQSPVAVELFSLAAHVWHLKGARVVHATAQPDGSWLTGVSFVHELTEAELATLLKNSPGSDQSSC